MMSARKVTVPVSRRALLQRINRRLAEEGEAVRAVRSEPARVGLGEYVRVDTQRGAVVEQRVDLEALGRDLGVLRGYEHLAGEG